MPVLFCESPVPDSLPSLHEVQVACGALGLPISPSELHGSLAGWLAGGGKADGDWLRRTMADDGLPVADGVLEHLATATGGQLEDSDFGFGLLLPDAAAPIYERSGALFEWCRGFLGGFGLAAGGQPPLSTEGREALDDLAKLAAASPQDGGDEGDEEALAEIEEFVRVATLLLHGDCALAPRHRRSLN